MYKGRSFKPNARSNLSPRRNESTHSIVTCDFYFLSEGSPSGILKSIKSKKSRGKVKIILSYLNNFGDEQLVTFHVRAVVRSNGSRFWVNILIPKSYTGSAHHLTNVRLNTSTKEASIPLPVGML